MKLGASHNPEISLALWSTATRVAAGQYWHPRASCTSCNGACLRLGVGRCSSKVARVIRSRNKPCRQYVCVCVWLPYCLSPVLAVVAQWLSCGRTANAPNSACIFMRASCRRCKNGLHAFRPLRMQSWVTRVKCAEHLLEQAVGHNTQRWRVATEPQCCVREATNDEACERYRCMHANLRVR